MQPLNTLRVRITSDYWERCSPYTGKPPKACG
jgi:hypothetical protein